MKLLPDDKVEDFIGLFPELLPKSICKHAIEFFDRAHEAKFTFSREETSPNKKKDFSVTTTEPEIPADIAMASKPHSVLVSTIWDAYRKYASVYAEAFSVIDSEVKMYGVKLQKTEKSEGYHVWHFESSSFHVSNRILAYIVYLNDVEEGGETEFLYQSKRFVPKAGDILIWPASYTHLHRGNPPLKGTKYIATGWFVL